jgi:site-specific recombinase XerD
MSQEIVTVNQNLPTVYSESANRYARASKARHTQTAYRSLWKTFIEWRGNDALPVHTHEVVEYITYLADNGYKVATINSALSAIRNAHELAGYSSPTLHSDVSTVFSGIRNELGVRKSKKAAIELDQLTSIVESLPDTLTGKRDKALLLLGFAGAFRRSELVALTVEDVNITPTKVVITIQRSKTDQEGQGATILIPRLENKAICPVAALSNWLDASNITTGAIFRMIDKWNAVRGNALTGQSVALILKKHAKATGMKAGRLSGHSLRRGLVNAALGNKALAQDVKQVTRHESESAFNEYVNVNGAAQARVIKAAFGE